MNARLDSGLLVLSVVLLAGGVQRSREILISTEVTVARPPAGVTRTLALPNADSLADAAATIVANDPFRLSNTPPTVRFTAAMNGVAPPPPVRPPFAVRAIVGGPPWSALLDGVPGQPGSVVVSAGSTYDKFRIRSVSRDTVVVQAPDTTWKLTIKTAP